MLQLLVTANVPSSPILVALTMAFMLGIGPSQNVMFRHEDDGRGGSTQFTLEGT
jgi:hypothetical protein